MLSAVIAFAWMTYLAVAVVRWRQLASRDWAWVLRARELEMRRGARRRAWFHEPEWTPEDREHYSSRRRTYLRTDDQLGWVVLSAAGEALWWLPPWVLGLVGVLLRSVATWATGSAKSKPKAVSVADRIAELEAELEIGRDAS